MLWLISTNGDGFGSLGWRYIPKMGTVTIQEIFLYRDPNPNPYQWKKLCIIQCNDRVWNPNPNPSPFPLVEMSHYRAVNQWRK